MAQTSWPFHDPEAGGTPVLEDQWSIMARQWAATGVVGYPNDSQLQVYANSSGREVHVRAGRASVRGHWIDLDAQVTLAIAANTSGNPRVDYVVARLDPSADGVALTVIEGTPAASPAAPTLTTTDTGIYDLPLATVAVANGAASITAGNVTDQRQYTSLPLVPCLSTRLPVNPRIGQTIVETDTGISRWWNGAAWLQVALPMAGGKITGNLEIEKAAPAVILDSVGIGGSAISFQVSGNNVFTIEYSPSLPGLLVARHDGAGNFIDIPWSIDFTNGKVSSTSADAGEVYIAAGNIATVTLPTPPDGTTWSVVGATDAAAAAIINVDGTTLEIALAEYIDATVYWHAMAH